jgi:hypothetical protein
MDKDNILKIGLGALGSIAAMAVCAEEAAAAHTSVYNRFIVLKQITNTEGYDDWAPDIHQDHDSHDSGGK